MKKILHKILYQARRLYWFIVRPKTRGVKLLVICHGKILMMQRTYGKRIWVFPGGAIKSGESLDDAVKREVKEDLGLSLVDIKSIGNFTSKIKYRTETIYCFTAQVKDCTVALEKERIAEARWFLSSRLPLPLSPVSEKVYGLWLKSMRVRQEI